MNAYADIEEFVLVEESAGQVSLVIDKNRRTDVRIQRWVMDQTRLFPYAKPEFVSLGDLKTRRETLRLTPSALRVSAAFDSAWSDVQKRMVEYFALAQQLGSSDIHITIMRSAGLARIEMRIHGELEVIDELTSEEGDSLVQTLFMSMCDIRIPPTFNDSDMQAGRVDANFVRAAGLFGARYQHMTTADGIYVALRTIVDDSDRVPTLEQQGFLPEQIALARHILRFPNGLVLLTGPTGSGKSTTLRIFSNMWLERTRHRKRLLTVENPVEGRIAGAIQTPVINGDWDKSNAAVVRSDPDAILLGEMQEINALIAAIHAAHAGHVVFDTLHANSAAGALPRMEVMGADRRLIADAELVRGLVSQRLVPTLCPHCSLTWAQMAPQLPAQTRVYLEKYCTEPGVCTPQNLRFHNPEGCENCCRTIELTGRVISRGITGRTAIVEIIPPDARFMSLWLTQGTAAARQYWLNNGGISRRIHLLTRLNEGLVDPLMGDVEVPLDEDELLAMEVASV
ncbi:GspE/PulE family protein [Enterobacter cloacae]